MEQNNRTVPTKFEKFVSLLLYAGALAAVISILLMTGLVTANVVLRRFFQAPLTFAQEYTQYLALIAFFSGLGYTAVEGGHVNVDLVIKRFGGKLSHSMDLVTISLSLGLACLYLWFTGSLAWESLSSGIKAASAVATPMWIPQGLVALGLVFFIIGIVISIVHRVRALRRNLKQN